jgi:hypothetical protein
MQQTLWLQILNQIADPQPIAEIAAVQFHTVAQMVNPPIMAMHNAMHLNSRLLRFGCLAY